MEIPYTGRAIIDEDFGGIEITIPTKKNWFIILFLSFWLCGWFAGEIFVSARALGFWGRDPAPFLLFWLCGWTVGGFFALRTFWWTLMGKEVISVGQGALTIDRKGAFLYKLKSYDLRETKNFRAQEDYMSSGPFGYGRSNNIFNLDKKGTIKFDYGMQTIKFGDALDEAEANSILQKLRDKKLIS
jgi:hypothetical protein